MTVLIAQVHDPEGPIARAVDHAPELLDVAALAVGEDDEKRPIRLHAFHKVFHLHAVKKLLDPVALPIVVSRPDQHGG
jgi:hypothetical protein